jgi:hypothetical protein
MPGPDDLAALKAARDAADRAYNDALTRLDQAIQRLPGSFPHPPPGPDEHQITPLNTLWNITLPPSRTFRGRVAALVQRAIAPLFEQQRAFNSAIVDHINRNVQVGRDTQTAIASTLTVLHDTIADLVAFQSVLVMFVQQITPYVDTRDRDVAGLLRGLSGAINAVADELMKRSEALVARDTRRETQAAGFERQLADIRGRLEELAGAVRAAGRSV